uniref:Uncharacterized protein n=1 Tax=Glossina austeni TaxID=7395 RepID=A0A1A9V2F8_GLOAU
MDCVFKVSSHRFRSRSLCLCVADRTVTLIERDVDTINYPHKTLEGGIVIRDKSRAQEGEEGFSGLKYLVKIIVFVLTTSSLCLIIFFGFYNVDFFSDVLQFREVFDPMIIEILLILNNSGGFKKKLIWQSWKLLETL